jgi:hypothetical protein
MNWQTREILKRAKETVSDEGVFSPDQVKLLQELVDIIAEAMDREAGLFDGINHTM